MASLLKLAVWYGDYLEEVRNLFSRKEQRIETEDIKFFSQYWQVFAWAAIIGFVNDRRIVGANLGNKTSIASFKIIQNGSEDISQALVLMALSKMEGQSVDQLLKPRAILNILGEYAEGGARFILEQRESNQGLFDNPDDYLLEIFDRKD